MQTLYRRKDFPYILAAAVLGSLLHFLYDFTGENPFAALISPINESTWEHLKLLFFPVLLLTAIEFFKRRSDGTALFASRYVGVLSGMLTIILLFYAYTGILGKNFLLLDIVIFFIGVGVTYIISGHLRKHFRNLDPLFVFFLWFFSALVFFLFTCFPPECFLFLPPQ